MVYQALVSYEVSHVHGGEAKLLDPETSSELTSCLVGYRPVSGAQRTEAHRLSAT